jgi:hypothetical protein
VKIEKIVIFVTELTKFLTKKMIIFMKTTFKTCLVAIALLIGVNTYAQDKPITFGVKAGVNLSNISGEGESGDAKIGFKAGVSLDYALSQDLYLMTGLNYSLQGSKIGEVDGKSVKLDLSYLQLPVHIGYKLNVAEGAKLVFHGGPYVGYAVDGKWKYAGESLNAFGDIAKEGIAKLKRFDAGLGIGAGVEFGQFGVDLGWDFGLTKINDGSGSIKNRNGYLTVGYKF